jgi:hypothetical protein
MQRETIFEIAEQVGFKPVQSCCNVPNKACSNDIWQGDIVSFANALLAAPSSGSLLIAQCLDNFGSKRLLSGLKKEETLTKAMHVRSRPLTVL